MSAAATRAGVLLGTAAYMSPEQARGKRVDRRADIWAFGCLLFELFTGKPVFAGETTSDILASVIRGDPDWSALPNSVQPRIQDLLRRCLRKDPKQRLRDIGEARIAIEEALSGASPTEDTRAAVIARPLWHHLAPLAAGIAVGALFAGLILMSSTHRSGQKPVQRLSVLPPPGDLLGVTSLPGAGIVAISPDGGQIVYSARHGTTTSLYLRSLEQFESIPLPGTDGAVSPFFSPDGHWIGFFSNTKLKKISVHVGEPVTLCDAGYSRGASWGPDDTILFSSLSFHGLMRVSSAGGMPQPITTPDASKNEINHRWPEILPGGKAVVFLILEPKDMGSYSDMKIAVERLDTHERKILPILGSFPRYSTSGHLLIVHAGRVFAVPFDLKHLEVTGQPTPVLEGVLSSVGNTGAAGFAVSLNGSLVYIPANAVAREGVLTWVDTKNQIHSLGAPARAYYSPRISPDGQRVLVTIGPSENDYDIWVYSTPYGTLTRLTFDGQSSGAVWSPDGKRIAFLSTRNGGFTVLVKSADGTGGEEPLFSDKDHFATPESWSPDGKFISLRYLTTDRGFDILVVPSEGDHKPRAFVQTKFNETASRFSPDGHLMAYVSDESGRNEVYVQPFPGPGPKWQVSADGGNAPVWSRNGQQLFYVTAERKIMEVGVTTQPNFKTGARRIVGDLPPTIIGRPGRTNGLYDVSADGQQLLFVKPSEETPPVSELRVILNWSEELMRLAPIAKQ